MWPWTVRIGPQSFRLAWPQSLRLWPQSLKIWPLRLRIWPQCLKIWPKNIGIWPRSLRIWPRSLRICPRASESGHGSSESGTRTSEFGPGAPEPGPGAPESGPGASKSSLGCRRRKFPTCEFMGHRRLRDHCPKCKNCSFSLLTWKTAISALCYPCFLSCILLKFDMKVRLQRRFMCIKFGEAILCV